MSTNETFNTTVSVESPGPVQEQLPVDQQIGELTLAHVTSGLVELEKALAMGNQVLVAERINIRKGLLITGTLNEVDINNLRQRTESLVDNFNNPADADNSTESCIAYGLELDDDVANEIDAALIEGICSNQNCELKECFSDNLDKSIRIWVGNINGKKVAVRKVAGYMVTSGQSWETTSEQTLFGMVETPPAIKESVTYSVSVFPITKQ